MEVAGAEFAAKILAQITAIAVDFEGRVLFWGAGAEPAYELTAESAIGRPLSDCFHCEYLDGENEQTVLKSIHENGKWIGNCLHTLKDGRQLFVEAEIGVLRDDRDAEIGLTIVVRDAVARSGSGAARGNVEPPVDEAGRQWQQLRSNGDVLDRFLENLPASAYVKDESGRHLYHNRAAREAIPAIAGSTGKTDEELFGPESGKRMREFDLVALSSNQPVRAIEVLESGGQQRAFQVIKFPILDSNGRRFVGGISLEVTESVRIQQELRKQAALLDLASDAIFVTTLEGAITYWNRGAERLYGWSASEAMGKRDLELLKAKLPLPYDQLLSQLLRDGEWEGEVIRSHRDGTTIEVLTRWSLLRDASGAPSARLVTNTNLTPTKFAVRELHQAQAEVEARAAELNAILDTMPAAIFIAHDRECKQMTSSRFARELFRLPRESNRSKSALAEERPGLKTIRDGKEIPTDELPIQRAAKSGEPVLDAEITIAFEDGTSRDILGNAVPLMNVRGEVRGAVGAFIDVTERKHAERQIGEARQKLENVLNSISDGLAVLDKEWRYTYFNEQGARMIGMRPDELIGNCVWDLFPHLNGTTVEESFHMAVESGRPVRFEAALPEPQNKWLECYCYPSNEGLSVYFRDATERRAAEEKIRASESRFRKLFESDIMGVGIPDRFGAFRESNDELLRLTGYSREDQENGLVRWDSMTPPEYADLDAAHIREAAERGSCTPYEKEYIRKDGTRVPILCGYTLLEGSKDEYIGFVLDLSEQKRAERELREREERFRVLAESLPEFVWIRDDEGRYIYCNQRLLDYVGQPSEWLENHAFEAVHPDDVDSTIQNWRESVEKGETYLNSYRLRRYDGVYRYFLARAVPMHDEGGRIQRWIGSTTDIHDQKMAEYALRQSEKLKAMARLASSMAHEINNPLSSVVNTLYLVLRDPTLNESTRDLLKVADQELARAVRMATQTLRFQRQTTAPELVDVTQIMDSALAMYDHRLGTSSITLDREYLTHEKLRCFNDELRQVFANLISNSLDAIKGKGRLRVRIRNAGTCDDAGTRGIRVTVADTGEGISLELQKRVFEPFVSTKESTGTGLGLWVSEGIVKKHNGKIVLRSSTDPMRHGTVFSVWLPLTTVEIGS